MPNLKPKIDGHNKDILENGSPPEIKFCNCFKRNSPMREVSLTENVLCYRKISSDDKYINRSYIKKSEKLPIEEDVACVHTRYWK